MGTSDPEKVVDEIFVRMDLDGNGTLSKSEFIIGGKLSILSRVRRLSPGHPEPKWDFVRGRTPGLPAVIDKLKA